MFLRHLRHRLDFLMGAIVGVLVVGGVVSYYSRYITNREIFSPIEFALVCVTLGGFIMVFDRRAEEHPDWPKRVKLKLIGQLYWAGAIAFLILGLVSPWVTGANFENLDVLSRWVLLIIAIADLTIASASLALATSLVSLVLWRL